MHRTDLVKRAFDHDVDVGAQISEEKPARALILNNIQTCFLNYKAYCEVWVRMHQPTYPRDGAINSD